MKPGDFAKAPACQGFEIAWGKTANGTPVVIVTLKLSGHSQTVAAGLSLEAAKSLHSQLADKLAQIEASAGKPN